MHETVDNYKKSVRPDFTWLPNGGVGLAAMLAAIEAARHSIRLEMYIFEESPVAERFHQALVNACARGVKVKVLVDGLGSLSLPAHYWDDLNACGGSCRWFNPLKLNRFGVRDHRKLLICDEQVAIVGGFNIATEYDGDGVTSGWRDLGLQIHGCLIREFTQAFDEMFALADFQHRRFASLRRPVHEKDILTPEGEILLGSPGRRIGPIKQALLRDFGRARSVQIISAYFLPTWRIRRSLEHIVRRGGKVQLILPAKSDVPLMRLATQSLYRRLLLAGVEIYEYEPQILHAKLVVVDDKTIYAGSANLDIRSLNLNYELLVRVEHPRLASEAAAIFQKDLAHCRRLELKEWTRSRSFWDKLKSRLAYLFFARVDPTIVIMQIQNLREKARRRPAKSG